MKPPQRWIWLVFSGLLLLYCLYIYHDMDFAGLRCVIADKDGNRYCVREREQKYQIQAANLLAVVTDKLVRMVAYMKEHHGEDPRTIRLAANFDPKRIQETLPTSELTAFSQNKGEKVAFCLNREKLGRRFIDVNTLTFVALHEMSHLMTVPTQHPREFWVNFKFLLENAVEAKLWRAVDYKKNPHTYCSTRIDDNPLYDL